MRQQSGGYSKPLYASAAVAAKSARAFRAALTHPWPVFARRSLFHASSDRRRLCNGRVPEVALHRTTRVLRRVNGRPAGSDASDDRLADRDSSSVADRLIHTKRLL
jgi:hypothetical protein